MVMLCGCVQVVNILMTVDFHAGLRVISVALYTEVVK
jgi:hypothetical protein